MQPIAGIPTKYEKTNFWFKQHNTNIGKTTRPQEKQYCSSTLPELSTQKELTIYKQVNPFITSSNLPFDRW